MKRSEINRLIREAEDILHANKMVLPPFAYWSPEDWRGKGGECDEIRDCMLGWDITDFGLGDFGRAGLVVFALRNGHHSLAAYQAKTYCEKILLIRERQRTPMHYHAAKVEDIINRNGGVLVMKVYNASADGKLANTQVEVSMDGVRREFPAGAELRLERGESITIPAFLYHEFWAEEGGGPVLSGEVSKINDDRTDNFFLEEVGRFPEIEEDVEPVHYLCTEYPA